MREDLPCEEPLPKLWAISLTTGGDLVNARSPLKEFDSFSEQLELGESRCVWWRVQYKGDGGRHVLCEFRFNMPEGLAVPQLGRLRELMLREARLLGSLSHDCIVPLERAWLEQRTGEEPNISHFHNKPSRKRSWGSGERLGMAAKSPTLSDCQESSCGPCGGRTAAAAAEGCLGKNCLEPALVAHTNSTATVLRCAEERSGQERGIAGGLSAGSDSSAGHGDVASFFLLSCVPLAVTEDDDDDGGADDDSEGPGDGGVGRRNTNGSSDDGSVHGDSARPRPSHWGGDDMTGWRGIAEPKTRLTGGVVEVGGDGATPSTQLPACSGWSAHNLGQGEQRTLCLASYILLPNWLPLCVWFETEFDPRMASPDGGDGAGGAVTAPEDWARVWKHLLAMFTQVVRGVEYLHTQGVVHNNVHPGSVWVAEDGKCRLGNMSQAAPPGCRRPPLAKDAWWRFASPERRRGCKVDSHSDVYSLGVLMLEFWRKYVFSRGLGENALAGSASIVDAMASAGEGREQPVGAAGLLDSALLGSMLANDPFDRPDCFEIVDIICT